MDVVQKEMLQKEGRGRGGKEEGKNIVTLHGVLPIAVSLFSGGRDQSMTVEDEHIWRPLVDSVLHQSLAVTVRVVSPVARVL